MRVLFNDIVVDAASRLVQRAGAPIHVSPKAFDLLVTLVNERPNVLSKEDLHQRLWPDTFVSDASLSMLVAEVRAALGESGREPGAIRTVHRRGYAFQAEATELPPGETAPSAPPSRGPAPRVCCLVTASSQFPLVPGVNTIGRDPASRVWLDSPSVSRAHAQLVVSADAATIEDLGSKNGTVLRGERLTGLARLADGDDLRFGSVAATFRSWAAHPTLTEGGS